MTDYLFLDGQDVLLLKRDVDGAEQTEYHPALIVARTPLKSADHLEQSDGGVRVFDGSGSSDLQPYDFTFDVQEATVTTPANPAGGDAFSYIYSVGGTQTTRLQRWSFAPGSGPVDLSLGLPGDTGVPQYQLQAVRQLAAGDLSCGSAPNP